MPTTTIYPCDDEEDNLWEPPIANIGDLGGYVESESNLSHEGRAWVRDNAKVFGNAQVLNNALVCGNAIVFDDAIIRDNSRVSENAVVYEYADVENNSSVYGNAIVSGNSTIRGKSYVLNKSKIHDSIIQNSVIFDNAIIKDSSIVNGHIGKHAHIQSYKDVISIFYFGFIQLNLTAYKTKDNVYIATEIYPKNIRVLESKNFLSFVYEFGERVLDNKLEFKNLNIKNVLDRISEAVMASYNI